MDAKTLALYLGCQIEYMGESGYTLNKVEYLHESFEIDHDTSGRVEYFDCEADAENIKRNLKLLLRPLSNMTEEEKLKLYQFGFTCNRKGLQIESPEKWHCFKPEQFAWLLSKGFDLFGLIEKGEAIDSTTLTPTP